MEIQCPSCQKKLSIGDQFAGQLVKCPACAAVFMAPTLALPPTPVAVAAPTPGAFPAPAPAAHQDVIPFSGEPVARPPMSPSYTPPLPASAPPPPIEPEPPVPPGDFSKAHTWQLCPDILRWVAPVAFALIFVLSFFAWSIYITPLNSPPDIHPPTGNLWELAFGEHGTSSWIFYLLLTVFLALPLAWAELLMEMGIVPIPDPVKPFWSWRSILVGGIAAFSFLLVLLIWFQQSSNEMTTIAMFLAIRAHLVAVVACGLEFWLVERKKKRLPLPELTVRW